MTLDFLVPAKLERLSQGLFTDFVCKPSQELVDLVGGVRLLLGLLRGCSAHVKSEEGVHAVHELVALVAVRLIILV